MISVPQSPATGARAIQRGDVLLCGERHGVVWRVDARNTVIVLPIERHNIPRHRGDVLLNDMADMAAIGCAGRQMMVRAGHPVAWQYSPMIRTGSATPAIMRRLHDAIARVAEAVRIEQAFVPQARVDKR